MRLPLTTAADGCPLTQTLDQAPAHAPPPTGFETGIELPRFCELMDQRLAMQEPDEVTRRSFRAFDAHAKGYISAADFERVMNGIAPHLPRETISLVFSEVDTDRDGDGPLIAPLRLIAPLIRLVRSTQIVMVTGRHVVKPQLHLDHRPRTTRPSCLPASLVADTHVRRATPVRRSCELQGLPHDDVGGAPRRRSTRRSTSRHARTSARGRHAPPNGRRSSHIWIGLPNGRWSCNRRRGGPGGEVALHTHVWMMRHTARSRPHSHLSTRF